MDTAPQQDLPQSSPTGTAVAISNKSTRKYLPNNFGKRKGKRVKKVQVGNLSKNYPRYGIDTKTKKKGRRDRNIEIKEISPDLVEWLDASTDEPFCDFGGSHAQQAGTCKDTAIAIDIFEWDLSWDSPGTTPFIEADPSAFFYSRDFGSRAKHHLSIRRTLERARVQAFYQWWQEHYYSEQHTYRHNAAETTSEIVEGAGKSGQMPSEWGKLGKEHGVDQLPMEHLTRKSEKRCDVNPKLPLATRREPWYSMLGELSSTVDTPSKRWQPPRSSILHQFLSEQDIIDNEEDEMEP